jgi:KDO2-lipid IV(A) lauroyltransferase
MQFIVFAITYPIIWILSRLPMKMLYVISDFFYVLIYYVLGYRKQVVLDNLNLAFPENSEIKNAAIRKKFFRHLMDLVVESIKAFTISEKEILKRYSFVNPELVNKYAAEGRSIAIVGAHQANWEWSVSFPKVLNISLYGAYKELNNKYYEKAVKDSRSKFGVTGFKNAKMIRGMQQHFSNQQQGAYILLSDQSPELHKTYSWKEFFNIKVPIHTGAEMLSKRFNLVVINYVAKKVKRGYYEAEFQLITDAPKDFDNYQISDLYTELTEKNIRAQPALYLWSHKRFKHRNKFKEWEALNVSKK